MRWWWLLLTLPLTPAPGQEIQEIQLGQAFWRAGATVTRQTLPDGRQRDVQADLYGLALERPARVRVVLRSEAALGVVVKQLDRQTTLGLARAEQPLLLDLPAGRILFVVGGEPPVDGAYLLSIAPPKAAEGKLTNLPYTGAVTGAFNVLAQYDLPAAPEELGLSADGRWLVTRARQTAGLIDLSTGETRTLPQLEGRLLRVGVSPDGWTALTVTGAGAVSVGVPDGAPLARFTAPGGIRDAVFADGGQRVAVLPTEGLVYVSSPVEGDLAYLPGTKGATGLLADPFGAGLGIRFGERELGLFDLASRRSLGRGQWPAPPLTAAVVPGAPVLVTAGPGASLRWHAGSQPLAEALPEAVAVSATAQGYLVVATGRQVVLVGGDGDVVLQPELAADKVAFSAYAHRLVAAAGRRLIVWDTSALLAGPTEQLKAARQAYSVGVNLLRQLRGVEAHARFSEALTALRQLPAEGEVVEFLCLTWLRLSQASYLAKEYDRSLTEADSLLETATGLPEGPLRQSNLAEGYYRRGDALWELNRPEEARPAFRAALDHGLQGAAADDARTKLQ